MWIALLGLVSMILLAWILFPLSGVRRSWAPRERRSAAEQLEAERDRLLRLLKDLEHEREAGTIGEREYEVLRRDTLAETAAVYRRIDEVAGATTAPAPGGGAAPRAEGGSGGGERA